MNIISSFINNLNISSRLGVLLFLVLKIVIDSFIPESKWGKPTVYSFNDKGYE